MPFTSTALGLRTIRLLPSAVKHSLNSKNIRNAIKTSFCHRYSSTLSRDDQQLSLPLLGNHVSFPYTWLRDSCQCAACVDPSTSQKLHRTSDVALGAKPAEDGINISVDRLQLKWDDGHSSTFPLSFLERYSSPTTTSAFHTDIAPVPWDVDVISQSQNLFVKYESLKTPPGLLSAMEQLLKSGLIFVSGVSNKETSNATCELRTLVGHFGEIRNTFYGETWDVKNVRNSKNIAYTNLNLDLHMDLLYMEHPPRYQILHCLRNRVEGGTSVFVDALHAASVLRERSSSDFDILASTKVQFHYINDGHHLHRAHPTFELENISTDFPVPRVNHINYSPPFQAPLSLASTPAAFYPALRQFANILDDTTNRFNYLLKEGDAVIFDNRRVLHARTAFKEIEGQEARDGETNRWLKGGYFEADALLDRSRVLRRKLLTHNSPRTVRSSTS